MAKQDFTAIRIKSDLEALASIGNRGRQQSASAFFTGLLADGLRARLTRGNFRPPVPLLKQLTDDEVFTLWGQWADATQAVAGSMGQLNNQFEFAVVPAGSLDYAEGDHDCYIPIIKGSCGKLTINTSYGTFPAFLEPMNGLNFGPLSGQELENLKKWLQLSPEI